MNKIFVIADLHFGHERIIEYCSRPYNNVEHMNAKLIKNWNLVVSKTDKVFFLGDFAMGSKETVKEYVEQLNGEITIIMGNHDNHSPSWYTDIGFASASKYPIIWNQKIIMSHAPIENLPNSFINIHGHTHSEEFVSGENSYCVSVEAIDYIPYEIKSSF